MFGKRFSRALVITTIGSLVLATAALADTVVVSNSVGLNDNVTKSPGDSGTGYVTLQVTNGTPAGDQNGCNATGATPLTVHLASNNPKVTLASPSVVVTGCGIAFSFGYSVASDAVGTATLSVTGTSGGATSGTRLYETSDTLVVTITAPSDSTSPVITPSVVGTLGNNGWYVSDVSLTWSVVDSESTVSSQSGCGPVSITVDQAATTYTCTATSAGGTASASVSIKRDATAPEVNPASVNDTTWRNSDLPVDFTASDPTSGLADGADAAFTLIASAESADGSTPTTATKTVYDQAGNSTTRSVSALIDLTAPIVTPADVADTTWRNTPLSQAFASNDGLSGLADPAADESFTLTVSDESANSTTPTAASRSVYDVAGNVTTRSLSALIDLSDPTITGAVSPTSPDGANAWYVTAPTVTFTCSDGLSGVASCLADGESSASKTLGESASAQSVGGTATDNAGNTATDSVSGLKVDLSDPHSISFAGGPTPGGEYYFGSVPAAPTCTALDDISGISSCAVTGYSTAVGTHTLLATATDNAGRTDTATRSYTVLAWDLSGFYSPVRMSPSDDRDERIWNTVKGGSTVPLKFEIFADGEITDLAAVTGFVSLQIGCDIDGAEDTVEFVSSGKTSLRYDSTDGQFIQNWQTPKSAGKCFLVRMTTADGSSLTAYFKLK